MPVGFFAPESLKATSQYENREPQCGKCGLWKTCKSPKMSPVGRGKKRILIVSEAPGSTEDKVGVQLMGNDSSELMRVFGDIGCNIKEDCVLTNAVICHPPGGKIPKLQMIDYCRPNLIETIKQVDPLVIILLGANACSSLLKWVWDTDVGPIGRWAGYTIPDQTLNAWICPTYHPGHMLKHGDAVLTRLFASHLKTATEFTKRPWDVVPDFKKHVLVELDTDKAAAALNAIRPGPGSTITFDFETNMLKPDSDKARIVCASVCWEGKRTISFPWHGAAVRAMKRLLGNKRIKKTGWNVKFEDRWCRRFGIRVRGWVFDGMLAAHALDNGGKGRAVTGLKFQAYVKYGIKDYGDRIQAFLKPKDGSKAGNVENRITEVDLRSLLLYCGLDSLLEFKITAHQRRRLEGG